ncbi:competence protein CoiA family protein [Mucilaginibacter sp. cycad4]|uniref:competence protein CoiA n=1 Tax=Mucilaginibacter sp. cycad4 TaxID=3342096 RepID=UPI002AAA6D77|nr:competence protein CoiA family protein [Mucilaginibacter gossypii]WPU99199.1 competence protein CoiA family protein [Mucilaginibacter gossypii]
MRFAMVDDLRIEAQTGLAGLCPRCAKPVIAKCGSRRIHHWAHRSMTRCDNWWEPETYWHRLWKNKFQAEWQEFILSDELTGEKHIADVRTSQGYVVEFQYSSIDPKERAARENFYQNMVWVVYGMRKKKDYGHFSKGKKCFIILKPGIYLVGYPQGYFPLDWLQSSVPVIFDFCNVDETGEYKEIEELLYCLFPVRFDNCAVVAEISRKAFVNCLINGSWPTRIRDYMTLLNQEKEKRVTDFEKLRPKPDEMNVEGFLRDAQRHKNRGL